MWPALMLGLGAALSTSTAPATTPAPATAPLPCTAAEHRQFDFWLGAWEVLGGPDGLQPQGRSQIESASSGCALLETWTGSNGRQGRSLNVYDAASGRWRQFWVGGDGTVLQLEGRWHDEHMELQGVSPGPQGEQQLQRIRWTPLPDGRVEQRWDTSSDGGKNWNLLFLGYYSRSAS